MNLKLSNPRRPESTDHLAPHLLAQVAHAGQLWDGNDLPASARLGEAEDDETCFGPFVTLWDVEEDGVLRYEAWFYMVDSGAIFGAGTLEVVAEVIQCGLECADPVLRTALLAAGRASRARQSEFDVTFH